MPGDYQFFLKLSHPNVAKICGILPIDQSSTRTLLPDLVIRLEPNISVTQYLHDATGVSATQDDTVVRCELKMIRQLVSAINYLHTEFSSPIVHGCIYSKNVRINSDEDVQLLVGWDIKIDESTEEPFLPLLRWMAPEIIIHGSHMRTVYSDIYAFGMTALEIVGRTQPYAPLEFFRDIITAVVGGHRPERPTKPHAILDELWEIIVSCWNESPELCPPPSLIVQKIEAMETLCGRAEDYRDKLTEAWFDCIDWGNWDEGEEWMDCEAWFD